MVFKFLGGFCGFLLAGSFVGYVVPIACHLPSDMSAVDTTVGLICGPPLLVVGFAVGFLIVSVIQNHRHDRRSDETAQRQGQRAK